jgi:hypothetical protein
VDWQSATDEMSEAVMQSSLYVEQSNSSDFFDSGKTQKAKATDLSSNSIPMNGYLTHREYLKARKKG